jgi:hypothetical protein
MLINIIRQVIVHPLGRVHHRSHYLHQIPVHMGGCPIFELVKQEGQLSRDIKLAHRGGPNRRPVGFLLGLFSLSDHLGPLLLSGGSLLEIVAESLVATSLLLAAEVSLSFGDTWEGERKDLNMIYVTV